MVGDGWAGAWALARGQHGVLTRTQALDCGLSRRQIDHHLSHGRWNVELPGVYRVEGAPEGWLTRLWAASLWAGDDGIISHRSAAALHELGGFCEGPVELTFVRRRKLAPTLTSYFARTLHPRDRTRVDGLVATTVDRTLIDLCGVEPLSRVRPALSSALSRRRTTLQRLEAALARARGLHGVRQACSMVAELKGEGGPTESELEDAVRELLRASGFPPPVLQKRVRLRGRGRRLDFVIPGTRVVIEADGYAFHSSLDVFQDDRDRNNALAARGFLVFHWTWKAIHDCPELLLEELAQALVRHRAA